MNIEERLKEAIRDVKDFPVEGVVFKDITPLIADKELFGLAVDVLAAKLKGRGITKVVAVESRGFILGSALAYALDAGFVPVRKKGKLPREVFEETFKLEYGTGSLAIHNDALCVKDKVVIADDLLATGGTCRAALNLVKKLGAQVDVLAFLIELTALKGRDFLNVPVMSIIKY